MDYLLGQPKDFHDFVNSISKEDKVGIITHTDVDGLISGIFLNKILESKKIKIDFMEFLNYGADVLKNIAERKEYDKLFFTDWNTDNDEIGLNQLRKKGKVLVFDHHPLNEIIEDKKGIIKTESRYCSSHALFDLAKNYFNTKPFEKLVCATIIADYTFLDENVFNFLKSVYPEITKENIFESIPGKLGRTIDNALIYFKPDVKKVYDLVLHEKFDELEKANEIMENEIEMWIEKFKNEAEYFPDKKLHFYYANPKYAISRIIATRVSSEHFPEDTIVLLSNKSKNENQIGINSRNQTGKIKLGDILKKCISRFENSTAGGHDRAAGGDFPKKYLQEFKKRILEELPNSYSPTT